MEQPDRDILDFIAAESGDDALAQQIASAQVKRRDYTRTGLFVYFESGEATRSWSSAVVDENDLERLVSYLPQGIAGR